MSAKGKGKGKRHTGVVVWFNGRQGYGWINVDNEENDAYVHFSDLQCKGYVTLEDGQEVSFQLERQADDMLKAVAVAQPNGKKLQNDKKLTGSKDPPPRADRPARGGRGGRGRASRGSRGGAARGGRKRNDRRKSEDMNGDLTTGTVISFFGNYGWIHLDDDSGDAYVHWRDIAVSSTDDGYMKLLRDDRVEFLCVHQDGGRMKAVEVASLGGGGGGDMAPPKRGRDRGRGRARGRGRR